MTRRLSAMGLPKYREGFGVVRMHPEELDRPRRWQRPRRIFVCSMSDLFHDGVSSDFIAAVWREMAINDRHTFMLVTKRADRMRSIVTHWLPYSLSFTLSIRPRRWPLPNVWLGVSAENQRRAEEQIPLLAETPAAVRFVSAEPLLGPITLPCRDRIDWVIAGCESGPGARPAREEWFVDLARQCARRGIPFFLKQMTRGGRLEKTPEIEINGAGPRRWVEFPNG